MIFLFVTGICCLCSSALLSKTGKKVLLLERHFNAGGFTHVFKRKGFEWDHMGKIYDRIVLGNEQYDFVKGVDNFRSIFLKLFNDNKLGKLILKVKT